MLASAAPASEWADAAVRTLGFWCVIASTAATGLVLLLALNRTRLRRSAPSARWCQLRLEMPLAGPHTPYPHPRSAPHGPAPQESLDTDQGRSPARTQLPFEGPRNAFRE